MENPNDRYRSKGAFYDEALCHAIDAQEATEALAAAALKARGV